MPKSRNATGANGRHAAVRKRGIWSAALSLALLACAPPDDRVREASDTAGPEGQAAAAEHDAGSEQRTEGDSASAHAGDGSTALNVDGGAADAGSASDEHEPEGDASSKPSALPDSGVAPAYEGGAQADPRSAPLTRLTIFIAGDSTVATYRDTDSAQDQAGWGQMLGAHFDALVTVDNRAVGGATSRHFIEDGRLDAIIAQTKSGDVLLVQFGTNDSNKTATYDLQGRKVPYYLDPDTSFKSYLSQYVELARR
jgi:hypothetical protein